MNEKRSVKKIVAKKLFWHTHTLKELFWRLSLVAFYTITLSYIFLNYPHFSLRMSGAVHSILGLALGMLLVFRTNTAYDRWWEGRRLWGALTNNARNLAIKANAFLVNEKDRQFFNHSIVAYSYALKSHLRGENILNTLKDIFSEQEIIRFKNAKHIPNEIIKEMYELLGQRIREQKISDIQMLAIDVHLREFTDVMGGCDRIRNTPMPKAYSVHLQQFLNLYIYTLPLTLIHELGYFTALVIVMVSYALAGLKLIGEEIEDPFGRDTNDLPLDNICKTIRDNVNDILEVKNTNLVDAKIISQS
jgi:ion channel-forming bestrophin family protein